MPHSWTHYTLSLLQHTGIDAQNEHIPLPWFGHSAYSKTLACLGVVKHLQPGRDCAAWFSFKIKGTQTACVAIKVRQHCCKLFKGRVLFVHKTSSCLLFRIWTALFKHMLHPHTVVSVSQQSTAEQLVKAYCSVNCIGMQTPSHLWINIHHGKRSYKETQGLWHLSLQLPRAVMPDGAQPTSSGHPFCASVGCRDLTIAEKESSGKKAPCLKDTRMFTTVLHDQLTANKASEKYPLALRISALVYCILKWRKSVSGNKLMTRKQPNRSGTLKGIQASVLVTRALYFIKAMLLRRR